MCIYTAQCEESSQREIVLSLTSQAVETALALNRYGSSVHMSQNVVRTQTDEM